MRDLRSELDLPTTFPKEESKEPIPMETLAIDLPCLQVGMDNQHTPKLL